MPHAQLLLRDLEGRTRVLDLGVGRASVPCSELFAAASAATGLPLSAVRLATGTRQLRCGAEELAVVDGLLPSCTLVLPLCGGKVRAQCCQPARLARAATLAQPLTQLRLHREALGRCSAARARAAAWCPTTTSAATSLAVA